MRSLVLTSGDPERLTGGYLYLRQMKKHLGRLGDETVTVSLPSFPRPYLLTSTLYAVLAILKTRPDIVIVDAGVAGPAVAPMLIIRRFLPPVVSLLLQAPTTSPRHRVLFERFLLRNASEVIVPARWMSDALAKLGNKASVIPPGCDLPSQPLSSSGTGPGINFVCAANWLPGKGILDAVRTFGRLPLAGAALTLVGDQTVDPAYTAAVLEEIKRFGLESRVETPGSVPWAAMGTYYACSDALLLPSYSEGMPLVCFEALRYGLPVIGYRIPALLEIVENEKDGLLAPTGDVDALAGLLDRFCQDDPLRSRLMLSARVKGASLPTWEQSAREFQRVLQAVTGRKGLLNDCLSFRAKREI